MQKLSSQACTDGRLETAEAESESESIILQLQLQLSGEAASEGEPHVDGVDTTEKCFAEDTEDDEMEFIFDWSLA